LNIGSLEFIWNLGFGDWDLATVKQTSRKYLVSLGICLSCLLFLPHCAKEGKPPEPSSAPDFTLKTLDGQEITLSKLKGRVVLLDFWATWCAPCREAIPHLIHLHKTYKENGLEVIGLNVDRGDADTVRRFVKSMDIPYPIAPTPDDVSRSYGATGLPTTILVDKNGRIRQKFLGFSSEISKEMTAVVAELIAEKP
jgi:thiol-disulfide isomerase/thioredoxin